MRVILIGFGLAVLAITAGMPEARACSPQWGPPFQADAAEVGRDVLPPGPLSEVVVTVKRGHGDRHEGCGRWSSDSCADMGWIHLAFKVPTDDRTAPERFGYRVTVVEGTPPDFMGSVETPFLSPYHSIDGRGELALDWIDGATDGQEPIDLVLQIRVLDAAGNEGPPVDVAVSDPGSGGCQAGHSGASLLVPLALVVLLVLARRRVGVPS